MDDLRFFDVVCRQSTLAKAAEVLGVSPPAVSRRLAGLEARLGVRLMNRTTRQLHLTPEGEQYWHEGRELLERLHGLEDGLRGSQAEPRGWLKVNASFAFGRQHMGPALWEFRQSHPGVSVSLTLSDSPLVLEDNGLDVGIRFGVGADEDVIAAPLATHRRIICASPQYLKERGQPMTLAELREHDCVVIQQRHQSGDEWLLKASGAKTDKLTRCKLNTVWACNEGEVAVRWAMEGAGIILRSEWDIQQQLADGRLLRVLPDWEGAPADVFAVYPPHHRQSPKVHAFVASFKQYLTRVHFGAID